ncbi:MAG: PQQ-binding-like beta-propeller repeat protein [Thermoplasmata archaeon]|nr:MAG: PQQ-binding-like beta-propeller repeat protein [Thermoplasmata archaeon]
MNIFAPIVQNASQPSQSLSSSNSGGLADSPWPMFRQNLNHTGVSPYNTSANPGWLKWSFTMDDLVFSSAAIGSDGTIYVGSWDNKLYAINQDGTEKWSFTTGDHIQWSSPAIDFQGTIYIGSEDNKLYAINPDGSEKWSFTSGHDVESPPTIGSDGTIYIGLSGYLCAIYPNGTEKWSARINHHTTSAAAISPDGTIYVGSSDYKLYAINSNGSEKWNFTTGNEVHSSPAIGSDGTIYIGSLDSKFYAINPDGNEKWNFTTGSNIHSSPAIGSDGTIYFGSRDFKLYALNPDGTEKWNFTTGDFIFHSSPAISSDGTIYIGSCDNKLYAVDPDGFEKWNFKMGSIVASSPAIGSDGTVYVSSYNGILFAIGSLPVADAGSDQTGNEGDIIDFDGSGSYDPDGTIISYEWDFDTSDGFWWDTGAAPDATGPTATHFYGDNGFYVVTLRVMEDKGGKDADSCYIRVNNVAPSIDSISAPSGQEGSSITFTSDASDPGSDDLIFIWNWSDGSSDTKVVYYNNGFGQDPYSSPSGVFPFLATDTVQHTYGDNGEYMITLTVKDDDGGSTTINSSVTINNVAPIISLVNVPSGEEGSSLTFEVEATDFGSDDLTFSWELECGPTFENIYYNNNVTPDTHPSPLGVYPFSISDTISHIYGDNGIYSVNISVEDDDGGKAYYNTTVEINNVAPIIGLVIIPSDDEGSSLSFEAEAFDPGSDDLTFEWEFEYGPIIENTYYNDGIDPEPDYDPNTNDIKSPDGLYPFNASDAVNHIYGDDYNYTLILRVTDDDGGMSTYTTTVSINNMAPSIILFAIPFAVFEGSPSTFIASAKDHGSDDLTFEWDFGDSTPLITSTYYNDGIAPDPDPSPDGIFPFVATVTLNHTYGDDYNYPLTLKVKDDDGGITTFTTTVWVQNVAPTIEAFGPFTINEGLPLDINAISTDQGSDDLTFTWEFEFGPTIMNVHYNNGVNPDPYPSPRGLYPFLVSDLVSHTYGDNGVFMVTLTVEDDDGGSATYVANITVNNVVPKIESIESYMHVNFTLRVAGEKYHSVNITLYEDDAEIWSAQVTRHPGSPDEQAATFSGYRINFGCTYRAIVDYLPNDPRMNGNVWGGNPVWVILESQDGTSERLHHTFNVRQSDWDSDHWNHIDPWEVGLNSHFLGHAFEITSHISDPGSDDETLTYTYGSQIVTVEYLNNPPNPDPFPSPEVSPVDIMDTITLIYEGPGTITLIIKDDDNIRFGIGQDTDSIDLV